MRLHIGRSVATHYEVRGNHLLQVIEADASTVYPVVADPAWTWFNAAYGAKLTRSETHGLVAAGSITGMCALLTRIAGAVGAAACGVYGSYLFTQAAIADSAKQCIFIAAVPAPLVERYRDGNCK